MPWEASLRARDLPMPERRWMEMEEVASGSGKRREARGGGIGAARSFGAAISLLSPQAHAWTAIVGRHVCGSV